jgi:hypothetical protein
LADEHRNADFVLELPDLLADPGLRRIERLGGVGDVQPVIDDRAEVTQMVIF